MWKGAIQFGLVTIPVKLYSATESDYAIRFNMLHETDLQRINMKVWCPADEKVISRSETVKGYEYAPDQYVVITDEDLEKVPLKTVRSIEIEQFAPRENGTRESTRFVKQAYYIEPDKIGRKAFFLLRQVLERKQLTAVCKVVIKDREALAALDPFENTMLLTTLHWPDEIRSPRDLELPDEAPEYKEAELRMAEQLVEAMTDEFDPSRYRDEYREALLQVIQAKVEGQEIAAPAPVEESANLVDLMKLLEASVRSATDARRKASPEPVSVSEAKQDRAAKPDRGESGRAGGARRAAKADREEAKPRTRRTARAGKAESEEALAEAKPARRRASA
jgi:DNA end-binding protein Ku